ncbi:MAG: LytR C-terminal domain-containing protein [Patescibacteria group bacterium]
MKDYAPAQSQRLASKKKKDISSKVGFVARANGRTKVISTKKKGHRSSVATRVGRKIGQSRSAKREKGSGFSLIRALGLMLSLVVSLGLLSVSIYFVMVTLFSLTSPRTILVITPNKDGTEADYSLIEMSPQEQQIRVVRLGSDQNLKVLGGYGNYRLEAIYPLLAIENKSYHQMRSTFSFILGITVDDLVVNNQMQNLDSPASLRSMVWNRQIGQTNPQLERQFLNQMRIFIQDRSLHWQFDDASATGEWFEDLRLKFVSVDRGLCSVAVMNSGAAPGLADRVGKTLIDSGFNVVRVANDDKVFQHSEVAYDDQLEKCQTLAVEISKVIPNRKLNPDHQAALEHRGEVVVFLGQDMAF